MRILFFDLPSNMAFNVATPETQPLGGMASCICYLTRAMAARGHEVTLVGLLPDGTPPVLMGVKHLQGDTVLRDPIGFFRAGDYDAVIGVNYPDIAPYVKKVSPRTFNVAWLHIYPDQPALATLGANERALDAVVCVSETLRAAFRALTVPSVAIGNAISPFFENMFASADDLRAAKRNRAVYASMPFRGLDVLVETMNQAKGKVELDVYSSMRAYQAQEDNFALLYEYAQQNPRIRVHGGVGQRELAQAFRGAAYLTYPSTFIESYCIVGQEAIAAGLKVISNDLGALPETTNGFADLLPVQGGKISREAHIAGIKALLEKNEAEFTRDPRAWAEARFAQAQVINRECTWATRAGQWEAFLAPGVATGRAAHPQNTPEVASGPAIEAPDELQQAVLYHRKGNFPEAERSCAEAVRRAPSNPLVHHFSGVLMMQRGKFPEAIACFDRAIALKADYTDAYNDRGIALCNLRRFDEAVVNFDKALAIKPRAADTLNNRGLALRLLATLPPPGATQKNLTAADVRRLEEALASFDRALQVDANHANARKHRAATLQDLGRRE